MKYRWNQVKQLMMALLMVVVVGGGGLGGQIYASSKLENGTYTIKNQIYHDSQIGQGMARSYTEGESELNMSSDGLFATVGFNNTQFMGDFKVTINSKSVSYEMVVNDGTTNIKKIKFLIPSVDAKVTIGLYVIPMDTEVSYGLTFDKESLKLIEKEAVKEIEESAQPEETKAGSTKPAVIKPESPKTDQVKQIESVNKPIEQEKVKEAERIEAKEKIVELVQQPTEVVKPMDKTSQVKDESKADKLNVNESKEIKIEADELEEKIVEETSKEEDSLAIDQREEIKEPKSEPELGSEQLEQTNKHTLIVVVGVVIVLAAAGASSIYFFKRK